MILDDEEQQEEQGLTVLNTADKQSGTDTERYEDVCRVLVLFCLVNHVTKFFMNSWVQALIQITCTGGMACFFFFISIKT